MMRTGSLTALMAVVMAVGGAGCGGGDGGNGLGRVGESLRGAAGEAVGELIPGERAGEEVVAALRTTADALEELTPEQEYYIGRAVAAELLARYPVYEDDEANLYLNRVGQALAQASDLPEPFSGYHFILLDTDEPNAFAMPGAFVFVTRGMVRACADEDALAAVLAHEIAHIQEGHGIEAVKTNEFLRKMSDQGLRVALRDRDVGVLRDLLGEVATEMFATLVTHGYGRDMEVAADREALTIMRRIGYDPHGLGDVLMALDERLPEASGGLGGTHPQRQARLRAVQRALGDRPPAEPVAARAERFERAMAGAMAD